MEFLNNERQINELQSDWFQSKFHMNAMIRKIQSVSEKLGAKFKEAGLQSFTIPQIWNKKVKFRLNAYYAYNDKNFYSLSKNS